MLKLRKALEWSSVCVLSSALLFACSGSSGGDGSSEGESGEGGSGTGGSATGAGRGGRPAANQGGALNENGEAGSRAGAPDEAEGGSDTGGRPKPTDKPGSPGTEGGRPGTEPEEPPPEEMGPTPTPPTNSLKVTFSPPPGTFQGSQTVELHVEQEDAEVHYTLDGSLPTLDSPLYSEPLILEDSEQVTAVAIIRADLDEIDESGENEAGAADPRVRVQGPIVSESYVRVSDDAASFVSHLPILIIHTFDWGLLDEEATEFSPATLTVLEPEDGQTSLLGQAALDVRIGIHVRGATSRRFNKKQYAVEFREDSSDEDLELPLLGMPEESDWVVNDANRYDRSFIRNALAFELSNRIGRYAPRTRFAEVYLVDRGGPVRAESFLGFYTVIEKIKRGNDRVDVARLTETELTPPDMTGGFIFRIDKGENHFRAGNMALQFVYPQPEDMALIQRRPQLQFIQGFIDGFIGAANAADFVNPMSGRHYSDYIDVDSWIDHNILNAYMKNVDALRISAYFHKDREGKIAAGPLWDFDRSMGTPYEERATEPEEWKMADTDGTDYFNEEGWWPLLFADPTFRMRYRDRFLELLDGDLAPDQIDQVIDELASQVGDAAARNYQRWPESSPLVDYADELATIKSFFRRRAAWIRSELANW